MKRITHIKRFRKDVVLFVAILGRGGASFSCSLDVLMDTLTRMRKYKDVQRQEFERALKEISGTKFSHWLVHLDNDRVIIS